MGKAYTNKKKQEERPDSDFYPTPSSLVKKLLDIEDFNKEYTIYEPADGDGAISKKLRDYGYNVRTDDIRTTEKDFLKNTDNYKYIITNPPFSLFDNFVNKAKTCCEKFAFIIKTNFFGAYKRHKIGVWENLKRVGIFNRQVDYRSSFREDGKFYCGNIVTAWAIWDLSYKDDTILNIIDVNDFVIKKQGLLSKLYGMEQPEQYKSEQMEYDLEGVQYLLFKNSHHTKKSEAFAFRQG